MKKPTFRMASFDDVSVWKKIDAQLRHPDRRGQVRKQPRLKSCDLISRRTNYDISFYDPPKKLKKLRNDWMVDKCVEMGLSYINLFSYFMSAVVVFPMAQSKEPLLVFKALGRVPGELCISYQEGITDTHVYPFAVYWKGQFHKSLPSALKNQYPTIATPLFWQKLSRCPEISEIPLALIRSSVYGKVFSVINRILRSLRFTPEKRGLFKKKNGYQLMCRTIVIDEYKKLCKKSDKYRKRIPVEKLADHLSKELAKVDLKETEDDTIQHLQTIRRWIKEHDVEATRWNELLNRFDKEGAITLPAPNTIVAPLLVNLSTSK